MLYQAKQSILTNSLYTFSSKCTVYEDKEDININTAQKVNVSYRTCENAQALLVHADKHANA